jgi:hypothetical protein
LDAHYLGTNDGKLWTLSQKTQANLPSNSNWSAPEGRVDQNYHAVSGKHITAGRNNNGGMEIFYIGNNNHIFHDWEYVAPSDFESNANQFLASNCTNIVGVSVTITVGQDIVAAVESGSDAGFSIQLNCWSPYKTSWIWQQYGFSVEKKKLQIWIDNWRNLNYDPVNYTEDIGKVPHATLPAGYKLTVSLLNDDDGNIRGAEYVVFDNTGNQICDRKMMNKNHYTHPGHIPKPSPINALQLNIVGLDNRADVLFTSGSGDISYASNPGNPLIPGTLSPNSACSYAPFATTGETSNMAYTPMFGNGAMPLLQRFIARQVEDN